MFQVAVVWDVTLCNGRCELAFQRILLGGSSSAVLVEPAGLYDDTWYTSPDYTVPHPVFTFTAMKTSNPVE